MLAAVYVNRQIRKKKEKNAQSMTRNHKAGIRKGRRLPFARGLGYPQIPFYIQMKPCTVHMRPCNPVGATLAVALAAISAALYLLLYADLANTHPNSNCCFYKIAVYAI